MVQAVPSKNRKIWIVAPVVSENRRVFDKAAVILTIVLKYRPAMPGNQGWHATVPGQVLFVVTVSMLLVGTHRLHSHTALNLERAAPYAIGGIAAFWTIDRVTSFL